MGLGQRAINGNTSILSVIYGAVRRDKGDWNARRRIAGYFEWGQKYLLVYFVAHALRR